MKLSDEATQYSDFTIKIRYKFYAQIVVLTLNGSTFKETNDSINSIFTSSFRKTRRVNFSIAGTKAVSSSFKKIKIQFRVHALLARF